MTTRRARRGATWVLLAALATAPLQVAPASASIPPGPLDTHPALGHVIRTATRPVQPTPRTVDGNTGDWDRGVHLTHTGGATTIQAGQLVYEDWLMDDSGAARQCEVQREDTLAPAVSALPVDKFWSDDSALGDELIPDVDATGLLERPPGNCLKGEERYGDATYPAGATPGSADIQELRVAADRSNVYFLVRFNTMTATDQPVLAVAVDSDRNLATGAGAWGFGSGVRTPGADHVITITRVAVYLDGEPAAGAKVASNDGGVAGPANPGGFGGVVEASVPRAGIASTSSWRIWAGSGVWDAAVKQWRKPTTTDPAPAVLNLAFRGGQEPLRTWMEHDQAFDLRRGWNGTESVVGSRWAQAVDLDRLAGGANERWRLSPGYYDRVFTSRVTDGGFRAGGASVETEGISSHQMYGLYIPTHYQPSHSNRMLLWLHWRGPGDHQGAYYVPGMTNELGEQRDSVVVSPRGRGQSGWYVGDSQVDVFDAMSDAEGFLNIDRNRVDVAGYSMGGWGAYMMAMLYPDLFASAFSISGPPAIGLWPYPANPSQPQNGRPLYWTNPIVRNATYVPFAIYHGTNDELVPVTGVVAQAQTFQQNHQPYRFFLFPGYEHFSFAIADEYLAAQKYIGRRSRVRDPAMVVYSRLPCLDPENWSGLYNQRADHAYWVSGIATRQTPSPAACVNPGTPLAEVNMTGTVQVTSHRLPRYADAGGPVAGAAAAPDQSTPAVMTGYEPARGAALPVENVLDVSLANVSAATIDARRARLDPCAPLTVNVTSDGPASVVLTGTFAGTISVSAGTHTLELAPRPC